MNRLTALVASLFVVAIGGANGQQPPWRESMAPQGFDAPATMPTTTRSAVPIRNWVVSATTSPLDYTPVAIATTSAENDNQLQLSIQCRGGKTDLVVTSPSITRAPDEYRASYRVNDRPPAALALVAAASGPGLAVKDDVAHLLATLPPSGTVSLAVAMKDGSILEGRYELEALGAVRKRLAEPCKWPLNTAPN